MAVWQIILLVNGILGLLSILLIIWFSIDEWKKGNGNWKELLLMLFSFGLFALPMIVFGCLLGLIDYLSKVKEAGGFIKQYKMAKARKKEDIERKLRFEIEEKERERIRTAYKNGELSRDEIPRTLDGVRSFEFSNKLTLTTDYHAKVRDLVYVENEYCESLNRFFLTHQGLRLYHMYRFSYLPTLCAELKDSDNNELMHYFCPNMKENIKLDSLDSTYPVQYLCYPEDSEKIKHGMMFLYDGVYPMNYIIPFVTGKYFHLEEGTDEEIIKQLDNIVHQVHNRHGNGGVLYALEEKPDLPEGKLSGYADELFSWVVYDDNIALITEDIRKKIQDLRVKGIAQKLLIKIMPEEPALSKMKITKELHILLPDYKNMEIKMEPLNKAVYLLFLKHPEGIIFKHLPDYREELINIYKHLKPFGLSERALHSIEDVTNPTLNSINEKCARIRGTFISKFDEDLAKNYFITGNRGEAKRIMLPRDLITWEEEI